MIKSNTEKIADLKYFYYKNPIRFATDCLNVTLSEKQKVLFLTAIKPNARLAVKSATGTGKTFTLGVIVLFELLCEPLETISILCTGPSAGQLERGLKAEIGKLIAKMNPIFKDLLVLMKEKVYVSGLADLRFASFITGSSENKESLSGVHAKKVVIIGDEASALADEVVDTLKGNLTTDGSSMILISNPVRPNGSFFNLFSNETLGTIWTKVTLTAFDSPWISKDWIESIRIEYGETHDFWLMRVLGEFPRTSSSQFIPTDIVQQAVARNVSPVEYMNYPTLLGVDVARFGDDSTVFALRQGPKLLDIVEYKGLDTMQVVSKIIEYVNYKRPKTIFIDGGGLGAGVVDRCKQLNLPVIDVVVSASSTDPKQYFNVRSHLWGLMKEWLTNNADILNNASLISQLSSMLYGYNNKMQIQLMSKKDLKKQGNPSPDIPDAISFTFLDAIHQSNSNRVVPRQVIKSNTLWG